MLLCYFCISCINNWRR